MSNITSASYIVVYDDDIYAFEKRVENYLMDGYECVGGVTTRVFKNGIVHIMQSMQKIKVISY